MNSVFEDPDEGRPCDNFRPDVDDIDECGQCGMTAQAHADAGVYVSDTYQDFLA